MADGATKQTLLMLTPVFVRWVRMNFQRCKSSSSQFASFMFAVLALWDAVRRRYLSRVRK